MEQRSSGGYRAKTNYDHRKAAKYQHRRQAKHRAEMRLVQRAFSMIPQSHRVLDIPCGGGRVSMFLAQCHYAVTGADISTPMIEIARENASKHHLNCAVEYQDIEATTYSAKQFETVVCFRLFHHFPTADIRRRVVTELCRVASRNVLISYYSPLSLTSLKRTLKIRLGLKKRSKFPTPLRELQGYFRDAGFRLVKDFAQFPLVHTLHLAVFERIKSDD